MKNTGTFVKTVLRADANNIVGLIDFNQALSQYRQFEANAVVEHAIVLEDFQVKVGLFSLLEAGWPETNALSSDADKEAKLAKIQKEGQKIYLGAYVAYGNGPWIKRGEEILQNKNSLEQPWALMAPFFSTNETALIDEDLKIGVRIEPKAQGNGGLKGEDYLTFFGAWRKVTGITNRERLINPQPPVTKQSANNISNSGTTTSFPLTTSPTTIVNERQQQNRRGLVVYNNGSANALFNYGTSVSTTNFIVEILPTGYFADPTGWQGPAVARATNSPTKINVAEIIII